MPARSPDCAASCTGTKRLSGQTADCEDAVFLNAHVALQDLPEHCVVENRNEGMMVSLGLTAMLLELAAIYCTLSFVLYVPRKRE